MTVPKPEPTPTATRPALDDTSAGLLVAEVSRDVSALVRQQVELTKVELRQEVAHARRSAELLGGASLAACLVVVFLSLACWAGLSNAMDAGWAALVVAGLWAVVGLVLFVTGRTSLHGR